MVSKEKIKEWELLFYDVWEDVDNDNCRRSTQNNLRKLNEIHRQTEFENKLLKCELVRLFDRLCSIVDYQRKFDLEYIDNWIKEREDENGK